MRALVSLTALGREAASHDEGTRNSGAILVPLFISHTQTITGVGALMSPHLERS